MSQAPDGADEDPYLWLEDVTGPAALDWVRERNAETVAGLSGGPRFEELRTEIRQVLDADERIPLVRWRRRRTRTGSGRARPRCGRAVTAWRWCSCPAAARTPAWSASLTSPSGASSPEGSRYPRPRRMSAGSTPTRSTWAPISARDR